MNKDELRRLKGLSGEINDELDEATQHAQAFENMTNKLIEEVTRVASTSKTADKLIDDIDAQFEKVTGLSKCDIALLFTAVALQCVRQHVLTPLQNDKSLRLGDQEAAGAHNYDRSLRAKKMYYSSTEEIMANSVPFDTTIGSEKFGVNLGGGKYHRYRTLGHDPLLGWIFGTANIMTRTITTSSSGIVQSFHVEYGQFHNVKRDYLNSHAQTSLMIERGLINPLTSLKRDEYKRMACALYQEGHHLNSDINSHQSLPMPSTVMNPEFAEKLSNYGVDMANVVAVGKQAGMAFAINILIAMIHRLIGGDFSETDTKLYEVRTRKVITLSNLIASSSNAVYVAITKDASKLDMGGMLVTIAETFRNASFIAKVKEEYLSEQWASTVLDNHN
ncbi:hypothetical protein EQG49_03755 [Periweissella cryptocerci]|uniref:Uncharacterized protein n=1 Tax=Periweissella cryptocerci TaxID=2506420 RepID=A0A4P6YSF4_9LACO|nr:hypothetical protein [Periweissella cryptocerci]QBO35634.1 hypothetical protein EQG49_03755 [Periweissella cryptocerci]